MSLIEEWIGELRVRLAMAIAAVSVSSFVVFSMLYHKQTNGGSFMVLITGRVVQSGKRMHCIWPLFSKVTVGNVSDCTIYYGLYNWLYFAPPLAFILSWLRFAKDCIWSLPALDHGSICVVYRPVLDLDLNYAKGLDLLVLLFTTIGKHLANVDKDFAQMLGLCTTKQKICSKIVIRSVRYDF